MEKVVNKNQLKSYYSGKKVFLTGHTGFKGAWLATWLKQLGAIVKGYSLPPEREVSLFNLIKNKIEIESIIADIRDISKLTDELKAFKPDFIFHLAAQPLVRRSYKIPSETFEINVVGTSNVLEAANVLSQKCTIVIITTDKVYENKEIDVLYNETDILGGYDPYSASKACSEIVVSSYRNSFYNLDKINQHNKGIVSVRAGNVIGGGDFSEDRIIPDIIRSLKSNKTIDVRNPDAIRPWQHVLEPLGGYLLVGGLMNDNPLRYSGAYNFGPHPDDHLTVKEIVELSINSWGEGKWENKLNTSQPHEAGLLKLDINKSKKNLNWEPKLNAIQAINWTMDWYKQKSENIVDFTIDQVIRYMDI